jgi:hypothetical protein
VRQNVPHSVLASRCEREELLSALITGNEMNPSLVDEGTEGA